MVRSILTGVRPVVIGGCELCLHHPYPELECISIHTGVEPSRPLKLNLHRGIEGIGAYVFVRPTLLQKRLVACYNNEPQYPISKRAVVIVAPLAVPILDLGQNGELDRGFVNGSRKTMAR